MPSLDWRAPLALLRTGFDREDWIAVFMKSYQTGDTAQRIVPLVTATSRGFLAWLRAKNAARWEIYVSTNAVASDQHSRTREAIKTVRHFFLEADQDGQAFLAGLSRRADLPPPSFVLHTSLDRVHALWRVRGFDVERLERLQKHLARDLRADVAATSASQTTRLPGFLNHKYGKPYLISMACGSVGRVYEPADFPLPRPPRARLTGAHSFRSGGDVVQRARAYLASVPPAVAGQRGDAHTFRVSCRLVRGFGLEEGDALAALAEWNARCEPPWSEKELAEKVRNARRYGREPFGSLRNRDVYT